MTHNVSRRTLAKGAAWAAPAVVATTAIPAYAASPATCDETKAAVTKAFADFATNNVPDLSDVNLRYVFVGPSHYNGAQNNSALRAQFQGPETKLAELAKLGVEFGVKAVDTSPAINNTFAGKPAPYSRYNNVTMPDVYPASANWDTRNGTVRGDAPRLVGVADNLRSGYYGSSFMRWNGNASGSLAQMKEFSVIGSDYVAYTANFITTGNFGKGGLEDIVAFNLMDGGHDGGRIYNAYAFRVVPIAAPTMDEALALIPGTVDEACFTEAYNAEVLNWDTNKTGLGGLTASYAQFGTTGGKVQDIVVGADEFAWSNELGNFHSGTTADEGRGLSISAVNYTDAFEFFDAQSGGLWNAADTEYGSQIRFRDGIY